MTFNSGRVYCHAILEDSSHSGGDDTIRLDAIRMQKGWLGAEIVLARGAEMDTHRDQQQGGLIEVKIDGDLIGGAEARRVADTGHTGERTGGTRRHGPGKW